MYFRIALVIVSLALFPGSHATAQDFRIQLGKETARFMYITEAFGQDFGRLELETGLMYNTNSDLLANVGVLVRGESVSVPMIVAVGARGYFANVGNSTVMAIAIGGDLLFNPESWGGFGAGLYYYTAPGVVSFADSTDVNEYGVYLSYQITPQASISLGYQNINTTLKDAGDVTIDDGGYFGLNLAF